MFGKKDPLTADEAKTLLGAVVDPVWSKPLAEAGMLGDVHVDDARVRVAITLPTMAWEGREGLEQAVRAKLSDHLGRRALELAWSSDVRPARPDATSGQNLVPGAKNILLFASGKGGVGKSTVATNVASALAAAGANVGLLDADIYGPSIPTMFGTRQMPSVATGGAKLVPIQQYGLKLMSIGFVVDPKEAMSWRGPMLNGALVQFMRDVDWGELDYLVLDLPPGTGDVQLTIAQNVKVAGAVLVSTPQDVALADVIRAKSMFDRVGVPILGVVENMSAFQCTSCGTVHHIFAHGGATKLAKDLGLATLGEIPIELGVREAGDEGKPAVLSRPTSAAAQALTGVARRVATKLAVDAASASTKRKAGGLKIVQ
jgi:ATP-binding protein involved in chromosome partitioning